MKKAFISILILCLLFSFTACGQADQHDQTENAENKTKTENNVTQTSEGTAPEGFVSITGGTFQMGSPESEAWRSDDEKQHSVTVSDFYMSQYEVTQEEYEAVMGSNPSNFSGKAFPVENVSWLDAVAYCNARSGQEGLTPAYVVDGQNISGWRTDGSGWCGFWDTPCIPWGRME